MTSTPRHTPTATASTFTNRVHADGRRTHRDRDPHDDANGNCDVDAHPHAIAYGNLYPDADGDGYRDAIAHIHTDCSRTATATSTPTRHADGNRDAVADLHVHGYVDCYRDATHADGYGHTNSHTDRVSHADGYPDRHGYAFAHANAYEYTQRHPDQYEHAITDANGHVNGDRNAYADLYAESTVQARLLRYAFANRVPHGHAHATPTATRTVTVTSTPTPTRR